MADVYPLHGIRYATETVGDLAQVVTPPYDVISPEAQAGYYSRNPYNVIRLELGLEEPEDNTFNNRYTRAATTLAEWRLSNVLHQDAALSYYFYQQIFEHGGATYTRTSLLARVRLEPWDAHVVLPHEHTLAKPKSDRLNLLRACAVNLSPIMSMYIDPQGQIRRLQGSYAQSPDVHITDEFGVQHLLYPITDPTHREQIQHFFADRQLYIADGHHRYETALAYRDEVREIRKELADMDAANFVLMALIDVDDPGMLVLPTHRLLSHMPNERLQQLQENALSRFFTVHTLSNTSDQVSLSKLAEKSQESHAFLLATEEGTWLLELNEQGRARMATSTHSAAWQDLDVAVAHTLLLEDLLGFQAEDLTKGTYVRYVHEAHEAWQAVRKHEAQAAILLNATRVRQICAVAEADDRMPQKSTYFYPKLITGLVMNPLW